MRKTSQITIFVFAALLVALPMTTSSVFAQSAVGTADLAGSCGITPSPEGIDLGTLNAGQVGTEGVLEITTDGTVVSSLEITVSDWTGIDGKVHLQSEVTRYAIVVDGTTENPGVLYSDKQSFSTDGEILELSDSITPEHNINLYLQISAEGNNLELMPYTGILTQTLTFESVCVTA